MSIMAGLQNQAIYNVIDLTLECKQSLKWTTTDVVLGLRQRSLINIYQVSF